VEVGGAWTVRNVASWSRFIGFGREIKMVYGEKVEMKVSYID
jgi:hypothetical protein